MDEAERAKRVIEALKAKISEPEFLDVEKCDDELYIRLAELGKSLCADKIPGNSMFYFVDSPKKDAAAIHELSSVVVLKGMLDFIFRIASLAAAVTPCSESPPAEATSPWAGNVGFWLEEGPFFFDDVNYWWLHSSENRDVFDTYVKNFFSFIVLHEIGHFHNMHGPRRESQADSSSTSAPDKQGNGSSEDFSVHVREIVADTYAFQFLWDELVKEISSFDFDTGSDPEGDIGLRAVGFITALEIVQLYFWLSALKPTGNTGFALASERYPPQAFRMQAIEATALEHAGRKIPVVVARLLLQQAMEQTLDIGRKITCDDDFLKWRLQLNEPGFFKHYKIICENVPAWSNEEFGKTDIG